MSLYSKNLRVYYEDTDCLNMVYHTSYLRWAEQCRSEWLLSTMLPQELSAFSWLLQHKLAFVVSSLSAEYLRPARLFETLTVTVQPLKIRRSSLTLLHNITHQQNASIYCKIVVTIALVTNANGITQAARLPVELLQIWENKS